MNFTKKYVVQWLGRYIKDFHTDQVESHIFKGEVVLSNLEFDCKTLLDEVLWRYLPFTLELRSLTASLVRISIPWHNLYGEPATVKLGNLNVEVELHRNNDAAWAAEVTRRQRDRLMHDVITTANDNVRPTEAERQKKIFHDLKLSMTRTILDGLQVVVTDLKVRVFSRSPEHFQPQYRTEDDTPRHAYTISIDSIEYFPLGKVAPDQVRVFEDDSHTAMTEKQIRVTGIHCFLPSEEKPVLSSRSVLTVARRDILWTHAGGRTRMTPFPLESLNDIDFPAVEVVGSNEQISCVIFLLLDIFVGVLVPVDALNEEDAHLHWLNSTQERPEGIFKQSWVAPARRASTASFASMRTLSDCTPAAKDAQPGTLPDEELGSDGAIGSDAELSSVDKGRPDCEESVSAAPQSRSASMRLADTGAPAPQLRTSSSSPAQLSSPPKSPRCPPPISTSDDAFPPVTVGPTTPSPSSQKWPGAAPLQKTMRHALKTVEKLGQQAVNDTGNLANKTGTMVLGTGQILFGKKKRGSKRKEYITDAMTTEVWSDESDVSSDVPPPAVVLDPGSKVEEWTRPSFTDQDPDLEYRELICTHYGSVNDKFHLRLGSCKIRTPDGLVVELSGLDFSTDVIARLTAFEKEQLAVLGYATSDTFVSQNIPEDPRQRISSTCYLTITSLQAVVDDPVLEVKCDDIKALTLKWRTPGENPNPSPESYSWNPMEGCIHNITVVTDPGEAWGKFMAFYTAGISPAVARITSGNGPLRWQRILVKDTMVKLGGDKKVVVPDVTISNAEDMGQLVCTLQCLPAVPDEFHHLEKRVRSRLGSKKALCVCTRDVSLQQKSARPLSIGSNFGERQFRIALASSSSHAHKNRQTPVFNAAALEGPNGLYISVDEYRDMHKKKADYERLEMAERMAKQQLALAVERMAEIHTRRTFDGLRAAGLGKKEQLAVAREKMLAMGIELQALNERQALRDKTKEAQIKRLSKEVADADLEKNTMRTTYEERIEEMRHTQLGYAEIIERQQKALDLLLSKRLLENEPSKHT